MLFLCFLVLRLHLAPFAELFEVNLPLHQLAILARPVVDALALAAGKFDELFLCHNAAYYTLKQPKTSRQATLYSRTLPDRWYSTAQNYHQGLIS